MNELGRDKLRAAALAGVPQIKEKLYWGAGRCAIGVLTDVGETWNENENIHQRLDLVGISSYPGPERSYVCSLCDRGFKAEALLIIHLNDDHELDFLAIANKL